jgi:outer membrane immunogenic protein
MKTRMILTGIAAAVLMATSFAWAADLSQPYAPAYKAPAYMEPAYANWSGFYLGVNAGYGFGSSTWDAPAVSPGPSGALFGATAGYNFQTGTWVWGVEGDWDWSLMKASDACTVGTAGDCETKLDWLATVRGRVGYAGWNNWLPYLTGGVALGSVKASSPAGSDSNTEFGWTAGAGLEYAWLTNWSVKVEYLYADLGSADCSTACGVTGDKVDFTTNLVRLGVNYRF